MTGASMNRRRWQNFRRNRRAYVSLIVFCACFALSLFAELLANDRPILVKYRDGYYMPIFQFYSEQTFGGDLRTEAIYGDVEVQCLIVTGAIGSLAALDFLGFGLPSSAPSLGELTLQAKQNLQAPWLGITAFLVFAFLLALLVFIFEGVRDAFDPRKTFS